MGVKLNCDECGRFMRDIRPQELAKMGYDEETVCDDCMSKIMAFTKKIDTAGNDAIRQIQNAVSRARAKFDKVIRDRDIQEGRS